MKFAAIDIGSNAIRLLLSRVVQDGDPPIIKKESLIRIPIRLGEDAFVDKTISKAKEVQLLSAMKGFKHLIEAYEPVDYVACATSAMREAENGPVVAQAIREECGINLEIVPGKKEAEIIYSNHFEERLDRKGSYLYIDVGGGSTELTIFSKNRSVTSRSFDIGTVRLLHGLVPKSLWQDMKQWLKAVAPHFGSIESIGSGGNINKIFRMSRIKDGKPITRTRVRKIYSYLNTFSLEERIKVLGLRSDRADVIIPASEIFLNTMKWAGIKKMYVPQIGLSDGLIHILYKRQHQRQDN